MLRITIPPHDGSVFLKFDLTLAQTYARIAQTTPDPLKAERNRRRALLAYDSIRRMAAGMQISAEESADLERGLAELKAMLDAPAAQGDQAGPLAA